MHKQGYFALIGTLFKFYQILDRNEHFALNQLKHNINILKTIKNIECRYHPNYLK